jgi:hypothetical protein
MMTVLFGATVLGNHLPRLLIILATLLTLFATGPIHAEPSAPQLSSDYAIASAGFFRLSWKTDAEGVELQEATNPEFRNPDTPYIGPDRAAVISGKPNGTWYYRVRAVGNPQVGPWSEPVSVTVAHHSLSRALMFLSLGVIIFLAIVLMIVRGSGEAE